MPAYHIERRIKIQATADKVRPVVEDFGEWPKWSPWLCMEPSAELTYQGNPGETGHGYHWKGTLVGEGGMQMSGISESTYDMKLDFIKPFKSRAGVKIQVLPIADDETEVVWEMEGKLPFFLFFMLKMMKASIGADYDRGLKMMKEYVETGDVLSKVDIQGIVDVEGWNYIGVNDECSMSEIGASMSTTLPEAFALMKSADLSPSGPPGAVYHSVDLIKQYCQYTAVIPVETTQGVDQGVTTGQYTSGKALKVVHTGSYANLGNAWSAAMGYVRYKKLKLDKKQAPYECYQTDPDHTPDAECVTEIFLPIRG